MREISSFQKNALSAQKNLESISGKENPLEEGRMIYEKFKGTQQEPVRLAAALQGFFMKQGMTQEQRDAFAVYLKKHIRNAVEALIEEDDPVKIEYMESLGWFGERELESFIKTALERRKNQSLIYLMKLKDTKYGYREEAFDL